jgi:succinoglycan biosynthesis transport protein ExoP
MELRTYLDILRRRRWLVLSVTIVVAVVAGVTSLLRTPIYRADARVLLRPNDPNEQLQSDGHDVADADRYLSAQLDIIKSEAVAGEAAKELPGSSVELLLAQVSASQAGATDIVRISARDRDRARATRVANAFAKAYLTNRREFAVEGLERAAKELNAKLVELQARIGELEERIARRETAGPPSSPPAAQVTNQRPSAAPAVASATPETVGGVLEDIGPSASTEALRAARTATTVQYETLYARQQELLIEKTLKRGEAELIAEAKVPRSPISPQPKRDAAAGFGVGLVLGLGFALLKELLDERLRSRDEAEVATGLPVLAELPFDEECAREPNVVASAARPNGALAEAARGLRTSLMFLGVDEPLRRLMVTSANSGEGKSLVAANLATVYAQAGRRTVLVSADLRRPRVDEMYSVPPSTVGLSDVIAGLSEGRLSSNGQASAGSNLEYALVEALLRTSVEGLFLLPAGKLPPNPAELLGSQRAAEVLDALSGLVDVLVIDTPPILAVTDAAVLASRADGVLLVASQGQTHKGGLARAAATLAATRNCSVGLVFNKVDEKRSTYGYGRYDGRGRYYVATTQERRERIPWRRALRRLSEIEAAR